MYCTAALLTAEYLSQKNLLKWSLGDTTALTVDGYGNSLQFYIHTVFSDFFNVNISKQDNSQSLPIF